MITVVYVIVCIVLWLLYHKIFNVFYFDLGRGCMGEILGCMVAGAFVTFFAGVFLQKFWPVLAVIGIVIVIASVNKNSRNQL